MRILMLSHGYPPTISGVTLVVQKLARAMVARGHQVTVVTASDRGAPYRATDQGVELLRVRSAPNPFWAEGPLPLLSFERLKAILDRVQPEVINTHDGALLGWQLYRVFHERSHVPEVLSCHFLPRFVTHYVHAGDSVERLVEEVAWGITVRMINGFDRVVFPSATQEGMFRREGVWAPSTVISNGLDLGRYAPNPRAEPAGGRTQTGEARLARYRLPDAPRLLAVGRLAPDKKLDVLIRSLVELPQAHLLLVGRGQDQTRLERLADELRLSGRVHFLGYVPEPDLPALYRACQVFAIASDVEVQSIPTMQAAACGLPIVAADAGALPELVQPAVNGYLAAPGDPSAFAAAIDRILQHPQWAAALGLASVGIGRRHDEQQTFRAYELLYHQLVHASPSLVPDQLHIPQQMSWTHAETEHGTTQAA
jgi:glycosyltransferase involved in cell wall biosynthesis